jgi:hypothetical protein
MHLAPLFTSSPDEAHRYKCKFSEVTSTEDEARRSTGRNIRENGLINCKKYNMNTFKHITLVFDV